MCTATTAPVLACHVIDLEPGDRYYDPRRDAHMMVIVGKTYEGCRLVADMVKGDVVNVPESVCLADRGDGRLYASRTLNSWPGGWTPQAAPDAIVAVVRPDDADVVIV